MASNLRAVGVPWFRPDTWTRMRALSLDRAQMPERFEEWLQQAEQRFAAFVARGLPLEKVMVDPDEIEAWAEANGRKIDAHARAEFAAVTLAKRHGHDH